MNDGCAPFLLQKTALHRNVQGGFETVKSGLQRLEGEGKIKGFRCQRILFL